MNYQHYPKRPAVVSQPSDKESSQYGLPSPPLSDASDVPFLKLDCLPPAIPPKRDRLPWFACVLALGVGSGLATIGWRTMKDRREDKPFIWLLEKSQHTRWAVSAVNLLVLELIRYPCAQLHAEQMLEQEHPPTVMIEPLAFWPSRSFRGFGTWTILTLIQACMLAAMGRYHPGAKGTAQGGFSLTRSHQFAFQGIPLLVAGGLCAVLALCFLHRAINKTKTRELMMGDLGRHKRLNGEPMDKDLQRTLRRRRAWLLLSVVMTWLCMVAILVGAVAAIVTSSSIEDLDEPIWWKFSLPGGGKWWAQQLWSIGMCWILSTLLQVSNACDKLFGLGIDIEYLWQSRWDTQVDGRREISGLFSWRVWIVRGFSQCAMFNGIMTSYFVGTGWVCFGSDFTDNTALKQYFAFETDIIPVAIGLAVSFVGKAGLLWAHWRLRKSSNGGLWSFGFRGPWVEAGLTYNRCQTYMALEPSTFSDGGERVFRFVSSECQRDPHALNHNA